MSLAAAEFAVTGITWYLGCGTLFAVLFLWRWVGRLDASARQAPLGFTILVLPGVAMLWPLFAIRLLRGATDPPDEWTAHRAAVRRRPDARRVEVLR